MTQRPTSADIAANVRAEVARRQVRQHQLAAVTGLDQRAVSRRLLGRVEFTASELGAVARLLEVPVARLLGDVDEIESAATA